MVTLILIDFQYLQKVVFSFEKGSKCQNHSFLGSKFPIKYPLSKIYNSPQLEGIPPSP